MYQQKISRYRTRCTCLVEFLVHFSGPPILVEHVEVACQVPQTAYGTGAIVLHLLHRQVLLLDGPNLKLFLYEGHFKEYDMLNGTDNIPHPPRHSLLRAQIYIYSEVYIYK